MLRKDLITCQQAAAILGRSPSTISRALTQGSLSYGDTKRKLIYRPGLEQRFANSTRPKADAPQVAIREERVSVSPEPEPIAKDYWQRLSDKLEFALGAGPAYWQQPSDPQRLRLFCRTIDELRSQCEMEGLEP